MPKDVAAFADRLGDRLSAERKLLYDRLVAAAPRPLDRYRSLSRDPVLGDVRLIDREGWRVDTASDDLACMIAGHWYPDWRRRHERDSLARYHDALMAAGVRDYSFDALWQDDRLSVLWQITTPV